MGAGCSCGRHPLLQEEAAKRMGDASHSCDDVPDAVTCSSSAGTESTATSSATDSATSSAFTAWCPAGTIEFRSPAEAARHARLATAGSISSSLCGRSSLGSAVPWQASRQNSYRMSIEQADADGGLLWMPLPASDADSLASPSASTAALSSGSSTLAAGSTGSAMPSSRGPSSAAVSSSTGISSGSLATSSSMGASGGLASGSLASGSLASSGALSGSVGLSGASGGAGSSHASRAQAREALQATLQQVVQLPYREFLRPAPPLLGPSGTPLHTANSNFGYLSSTPPPAVEEMLTAAVRHAGVDTAILTINATRRVWVRNNQGFRPGAFPWCWSAWQTRAPAPQLLVVPDTLEVPRLAASLAGAPPPHVRFFAGIPLLGDGGLVLGSLSLVASEPRAPTDEQCTAFTKLAARVAAELAKDTAAVQLLEGRPGNSIDRGDVGSMESAAVHSMRSRAILFVDAAQQQWQILHANEMLAEVTGTDAAAGQPLWQVFTRPFAEDSAAWEAALEVAARGDEFILRCCRVADAPERGTFSLQFRPADQGGLDDDAELADLPAQLPSAPGDAGHPFFVIVTPEAVAAGPDDKYTPVQALNLKQQRPVDTLLVAGLELGPLLARGSFGSVYRGRYKGKKVAIKVCAGNMQLTKGKTLKPWKNMEALQVRRLQHPNIVAALKHATVINQDGDVRASSWTHSSGGSRGRSQSRSAARDSSAPTGSGAGSGLGSGPHSGSVSSGGPSTAASWSADVNSDDGVEASRVEMETWLVMEYCNRGTLRSGIDRGFFRAAACRGGDAAAAGQPGANTAVVLAIAAEMASAMAYLHSRNVVHGDLCGTNVMLTTDKSKPAGFTSKIADFGLSRELKTQTISTVTYGTVTHMPPELMLEQRLTTASDVFSFGVLLWEMYNSQSAWEGMSHTQVIAKVTMEGQRLAWPADAHPAIKDLSERCTDTDPLVRPTFPAIQEELAALQAALQQQATL